MNRLRREKIIRDFAMVLIQIMAALLLLCACGAQGGPGGIDTPPEETVTESDGAQLPTDDEPTLSEPADDDPSPVPDEPAATEDLPEYAIDYLVLVDSRHPRDHCMTGHVSNA